MTDPAELRRQGMTRWLVLLLMSLIIAANYYLYDSFSTLKETMQTELDMTSGDYGLIKSMYQWPNVFLVMAVLGGIILDRFGIRRAGFVFTLFCGLGAVVTAYGASPAFLKGGFGYDFVGSFKSDWSPQLKMMMLGRLLYGLGAETQIVMQNKVIAKWFKGKELALAFGVNLAIARLGSAASFFASPRIAEAGGHWTAALWVAAVFMLSGLVFFVLYMIIDQRDERRLKLAIDRTGKLAPDEVFRIKDITKVLTNPSFVFITLLCVTYYSAVFPFTDYLPDYLTHKFGYSATQSGEVTFYLPLCAAVFTIIFSAYVDRWGKRASLMIYGSVLLAACHFLFALTRISPYVLVPLFGVVFSLVPAAMWPAVALIIKERWLGTAYGLMASLQNLGMWWFTKAAGNILDRTNPTVTPEALKAGATYDYTQTILMFAYLGIAGIVFALGLKWIDKGPRSHGLELSSRLAAELARKRGEVESA